MLGRLDTTPVFFSSGGLDPDSIKMRFWVSLQAGLSGRIFVVAIVADRVSQ